MILESAFADRAASGFNPVSVTGGPAKMSDVKDTVVKKDQKNSYSITGGPSSGGGAAPTPTPKLDSSLINSGGSDNDQSGGAAPIQDPKPIKDVMDSRRDKEQQKHEQQRQRQQEEEQKERVPERVKKREPASVSEVQLQDKRRRELSDQIDKQMDVIRTDENNVTTTRVIDPVAEITKAVKGTGQEQQEKEQATGQTKQQKVVSDKLSASQKSPKADNKKQAGFVMYAKKYWYLAAALLIGVFLNYNR